MDLTKLSEEFAPEDIEWRIGRAGKSGQKIWATCFAYVTNRAIMDRLDSVCGIDKWKNEYQEFTVGSTKGTLCGISIKTDEGWITKWDGADPSQTEAFKGGLSDSMKRAAVQWGIGRYLYNIEEGFANIVPKGKGAKYAKLSNEQGEDIFYWTPPALKRNDTKPIVTTEKMASVAQLDEIASLCKKLDKDLAGCMKHYCGTQLHWNYDQAVKAIDDLKSAEKVLNKELNQAS